MKSNLIIILGMSGTGKTTLARKLANDLDLPLVSKDDLKVIIFDNVGWKDMEWSKKVGRASYQILDYLIEDHLKTGQSMIVETTFDPRFADSQFQEWQNKYGFRAIQVLCYADEAVARQRFRKRAAIDGRHPSHGEGEEGKENFEYRLKNNLDRPLKIESKIIKVDSTDFSKLDEVKVIKEIRTYLDQE